MQMNPYLSFKGRQLAGQGDAHPLRLDGPVLMGGDVAPDQFEAPKGFSISLTRKHSGPNASPTSSIVSGSRG